MNFKIAFVGAALMAFAGIVTVGCGGSACETAADDITAKQASCPDYVAPTTTTDGATVECTDALGTQSACAAACITASTCECIGLDKSKMCAAADSTKYLTCVTDCTK